MRCWSSTANGGCLSHLATSLLLFAQHLPLRVLVIVQDGLARESAAANDPVNHPVPDKEFMRLSHMAALPVQPSLCGFEVCIACCGQGRHS